MYHGEVEVLERQVQAANSSIHVFRLGHPLEWGVVRYECETSSQEVVLELQDCPLNSQGLPFHCGVTGLSVGELLAYIDYRVFLTPVSLGQDRA